MPLVAAHTGDEGVVDQEVDDPREEHPAEVAAVDQRERIVHRRGDPHHGHHRPGRRQAQGVLTDVEEHLPGRLAAHHLGRERDDRLREHGRTDAVHVEDREDERVRGHHAVRVVAGHHHRPKLGDQGQRGQGEQGADPLHPADVHGRERPDQGEEPAPHADVPGEGEERGACQRGTPGFLSHGTSSAVDHPPTGAQRHRARSAGPGPISISGVCRGPLRCGGLRGGDGRRHGRPRGPAPSRTARPARVQDRHAEGDRLVVLGPGVLAHHDEPGALGDRSADLAAELLDGLGGAVAGPARRACR